MARQQTPGTAITLGLLMLLCGSIWQVAASQTLTARSSPHTVALLELYTSEGCNSCPTADSWVSSLPAQGFRPEQVIPLAFHVDYWDYLGWPDRFAKAVFTQRQRAMAALHYTRTIYTPQVLLQGKDFRTWHSLGREVERINQTPARADITLQITAAQQGEIAVQIAAVIPAPTDRQQAFLYVALYESQLQSAVNAGENQGRTLHHDFVVRHWLGPVPLDGQGSVTHTSRLSIASDWKPADLGLVVFMQQQHTGEVLQALALPLSK
jgi:hypothetical protein